MADISRRRFLRGATITVVAAGTAAAAPAVLGADPAGAAAVLQPQQPGPGTAGGRDGGQLVFAHVGDDGAITLYVDTREITIRDRRIARALRTAVGA